MSKKTSPLSSSVPDWLREQIETARRMVDEHERRGNTNTYWHAELERRRESADAYDEVEAEPDDDPTDVDDAGAEPEADANPLEDVIDIEETDDA